MSRSSILCGACAVVVCVVIWRWAGGPWRWVETAAVRGLLSIGGVHAAQLGDQLVIDRHGAPAFVASIGPWCSALGPVLVFVMMGALAPQVVRRRSAVVATASTVVVLANIVRLVGVLAIGAIGDTAELEHWHDGAGVVLAVGVVLGASGWLLSRLWPMPQAARVPVGPTSLIR